MDEENPKEMSSSLMDDAILCFQKKTYHAGLNKNETEVTAL